jgi:hypothetical protein
MRKGGRGGVRVGRLIASKPTEIRTERGTNSPADLFHEMRVCSVYIDFTRELIACERRKPTSLKVGGVGIVEAPVSSAR